MTRTQHVEQHVSAGGVVSRAGENGTEVVLCGRLSPTLWALPKGTPSPGETRVQTAVREVTEETGLEVSAGELIGETEYWFVRPSDGVRCHKRVYFYMMSPSGGDTSLHDREFDRVEWFPADKALTIMTYGNEVGIVEKGLTMVSQEGSA